MATFNLLVGGPKGAELTKLADGAIVMGRLIRDGTTKGTDVAEAAATGAQPWGVALIDERIARENESGGASVFTYSDNQVCRVMTLVPGQVLNLTASGAISAGSGVYAVNDGTVRAMVITATGTICLGVALEAITDASTGKVLLTTLRTYPS